MEMERNTILIADDEELNRSLLKQIFEEQFRIVEARDGEEAIQLLKEDDTVCLLLLDLMMPKKSGLDVMKFMKDNGYMERIPVIMITGEATLESDLKAYEYGASEIIYKPFAASVVMRRSLNTLELFESRRNMEAMLAKRTEELREAQTKLKETNEFLINTLSAAIELRSLESDEHIQRVREFTRLVLNYLKQHYPEYKLTDGQIDLIVSASALHDIGKIAIPDSILLKPGKLTKKENAELKKHTIYGCQLFENFKQEDNEFYRYCYDICRSHHERYDGSGYPDGLVGEEIPIWAQAVSIVDVYDDLISKRAYKIPYANDLAIEMIHDGECGAFSPKILDCFDLARSEFFQLSEHMTYADQLPTR